MKSNRFRCQALIIGAGLAGCTTALTLADQGISVTILTPEPVLDGGNSAMAQGGVVYVADKDDQRTLEKDMDIAGHCYNYPKAVRFLAMEGGASVEKVLINRLNVPFNHREADDGEWDLALEGGHSIPRVLHCADYTGQAIMEAMHAAISEHSNISVLCNRTAVDLVTTEHHATGPAYRYILRNECVGAYVFNNDSLNVELHLADITVLATGGIGQIYLHSTNSPWAIGAGISMAQRAGVRLANMEFVQFHPTALYHREQKRSLITEAMRGEGAILRNHKGEAFMERYDSRGDLAPRDIVSRSIVAEMLETGEDHVLLDARGMTCDVPQRFPTVFKNCRKIGIDILETPIPVVPAAHYFCGGILVDLRGRTTLDRLYAVGECSCTGIHGANRLASTSLLEAVLWGQSSGKDIVAALRGKDKLSKRILDAIPDWRSTGDEHNDDPALIAQDWATIRNTMWNYVGIMRTEKRLRRAFADLRDLSSHLHDFYRLTPLSKDLVRLFHGCQTAYLVTQAALRNKQSLGCHYRED